MNTENGLHDRVDAAKLTRLVAAWFARNVVMLALGLFTTIPTVAETKPNIVFILADNLGWKDVGYHGSEIKTPNVDELRKPGLGSSSSTLCRCARPLARH